MPELPTREKFLLLTKNANLRHYYAKISSSHLHTCPPLHLCSHPTSSQRVQRQKESETSFGHANFRESLFSDCSCPVGSLVGLTSVTKYVHFSHI